MFRSPLLVTIVPLESLERGVVGRLSRYPLALGGRHVVVAAAARCFLPQHRGLPPVLVEVCVVVARDDHLVLAQAGRRLRAFAHTHLSACARPRRGRAWRATRGGFGARTGAAFRCISSRFARSVASTVAIFSSAPSGTSMMPASQRFASSS